MDLCKQNCIKAVDEIPFGLRRAKSHDLAECGCGLPYCLIIVPCWFCKFEFEDKMCLV